MKIILYITVLVVLLLQVLHANGQGDRGPPSRNGFQDGPPRACSGRRGPPSCPGRGAASCPRHGPPPPPNDAEPEEPTNDDLLDTLLDAADDLADAPEDVVGANADNLPDTIPGLENLPDEIPEEEDLPDTLPEVAEGIPEAP